MGAGVKQYEGHDVLVYECPRCGTKWDVFVRRVNGHWDIVDDGDVQCPKCKTIGKQVY